MFCLAVLLPNAAKSFKLVKVLIAFSAWILSVWYISEKCVLSDKLSDTIFNNSYPKEMEVSHIIPHSIRQLDNTVFAEASVLHPNKYEYQEPLPC